MRTPLNEDVHVFGQHMCRSHHAIWFDKQDSPIMQLAGWLLERVRELGHRLPDLPTFLNDYATTIGAMIWIPTQWTPEQKLITLAHECQHVKQFWQGGLGLPGGLGMEWLYLVNTEARVRFEAEAYHTTMEVQKTLLGQVQSVDHMTHMLEGGYALDPKQVQFGKDLLVRNATSVEHGIISTEAGQSAVAWIQQNLK